MSDIKAPLQLRIRNGLAGTGRVLRRPQYLALAAVTSFFVSGFIIWSLNFELVQFIVFEAPLTLASKLRFFWDVQTGIYTAYSSTQATGILLFGVLFGINAAMITYVLKNGGFKQIPKKSGGAGFALALLSGGCVACGTSILAPILATFGATSSVFLSDLSNYLNWGSSLLIIYSIYKLGGVVNNTYHLRDTEVEKK